MRRGRAGPADVHVFAEVYLRASGLASTSSGRAVAEHLAAARIT